MDMDCYGREMAERLGFETRLELPLNTLSKRAPSATRPSLHAGVALLNLPYSAGPIASYCMKAAPQRRVGFSLHSPFLLELHHHLVHLH